MVLLPDSAITFIYLSLFLFLLPKLLPPPQMAWSDAATGRDKEARAGRLECTMQNIADHMYAESPRPLGSDEIEGLDTFVVYNRRRKVGQATTLKFYSSVVGRISSLVISALRSTAVLSIPRRSQPSSFDKNHTPSTALHPRS